MTKNSIRTTVASDMQALLRALQKKDWKAAEKLAKRIVASVPDHPVALKTLARRAMLDGEYRGAETLLRRALAMAPDDGEIHANLGACLFEFGMRNEAVQLLQAALPLAAQCPDISLNLARAQAMLGRYREAAVVLQNILERQPNNADVHRRLANILVMAGNREAALSHLLRYVDLIPRDDPEALILIAELLFELEHYANAKAMYDQIWENFRKDLRILGGRVASRLHICDYHDTATLTRQLTVRAATNVPRMSPLLATYVPGFDGGAHLRIAAEYAKQSASAWGNLPILCQRRASPLRPHKLKIGYLSDDFRDHATTHLMVGMLEQHDRDRFEVCGYSTGFDDNSISRRRVEKAFDRFRDFHGETDEAAARCILADEIDILVDAKGWTFNNRLAILAYRPAPIQVTWLAFPGTLGDRRLADYLIADPWVVPLQQEDFYSETIVRLPVCYQPTDDRRVIPMAPTRDAVGLPDGAVVYCSFNQPQKINVEVFDLWCRLLDKVPDSVLWLLTPGLPDAVDNLRQAAVDRDINPDRIIFAPKVSSEAHLARLQLADLALDTFPYNSHTTASDALWCGVPMVTVLGETFAGRVGASILNAIDMGRMVAADQEGYLAIAIQVGTDEVYRRTLKDELMQKRCTTPLFDSRRFARDMEALYDSMWRQDVQ